MKYPDLAIIIPVRKEENNITTTLREMTTKINIPHNIYVIDDSIDSSDLTKNQVKLFQRKHSNVFWVPKKRGDLDGFGPALIRGAKFTPEKYIVIVMGDLCDDPLTINQMYRQIKKGYDIVCGSRYMTGGSKSGGPFMQHIFSTIVNYTLKIITRSPTLDISNAFKMYKRDVFLKSCFGEIPVGVEASMKIYLNAFFKDANITEVPTSWIGRIEGESKFKIIERFPRYLKVYCWVILKSL